MIVIDANVLLHCVNQDSALHDRVLPWWESTVNNDEPVGLPWIVLLAFYRISTHRNVFPRPLTSHEAIQQIDQWLSLPNVKAIVETPKHWNVLRKLLRDTKATGNLSTDAHLAAIAIEFSATLASCDADFNRFPGIRWANPIAVADNGSD